MLKQFLFIAIALFVFAGCNLTRFDVVGKWKGQFDDTLIINQDNSFLYIKDEFSKADSNDSFKKNVEGQWTLSKKSIYFNFNDTSQNFGGNCKVFYYRQRLFANKKFIRPNYCDKPTHRFIIMNKVE